MYKLKISALLILSATTLGAQLPEKAEDIAPLLIGEIFPDLEVMGLDGKTLSFYEVLQTKPTVLIFYRGGWCPYCNRHLAEIGQKEKEIIDLGYQIVAISPDKIEKLQEAREKDGINYRLLSDADGRLAKAAGIAFQSPERYGQRLLAWSGGQNTGFLPVPSVFVLGTDGKIRFEYINPDYKERLSGDLLVAILREIEVE